jgi:hypothetical protein
MNRTFLLVVLALWRVPAAALTTELRAQLDYRKALVDFDLVGHGLGSGQTPSAA